MFSLEKHNAFSYMQMQIVSWFSLKYIFFQACYKVLEEQTVPRHICIDCYENSNDSEIWVHPEIINDKDRKVNFQN